MIGQTQVHLIQGLRSVLKVILRKEEARREDSMKIIRTYREGTVWKDGWQGQRQNDNLRKMVPDNFKDKEGLLNLI